MRIVANKHWQCRRQRRSGFTLIEAALVTVIVGVGFMAMLQLLATGTVANVQGAQTTTGMNLAKNIREMSLKMKFVDLPTLNSKSYNPPIDSRGTSLTDFSAWKQQVKVQAVDPDRMTLDISDPSPSAIRITVTVSRNNQTVCQMSWYVFDGTP